MLLPPSLGELLTVDHPARFVAEVVDGLDVAEVGIRAQATVEGAPAYHPKMLLGAWLYGFMAHVRSSRKIELACRETIPFMWLTVMQRPDHVTLWRFYKQNRKVMRSLLKQTVSLASDLTPSPPPRSGHGTAGELKPGDGSVGSLPRAVGGWHWRGGPAVTAAAPSPAT